MNNTENNINLRSLEEEIANIETQEQETELLSATDLEIFIEQEVFDLEEREYISISSLNNPGLVEYLTSVAKKSALQKFQIEAERRKNLINQQFERADKEEEESFTLFENLQCSETASEEEINQAEQKLEVAIGKRKELIEKRQLAEKTVQDVSRAYNEIIQTIEQTKEKERENIPSHFLNIN